MPRQRAARLPGAGHDPARETASRRRASANSRRAPGVIDPVRPVRGIRRANLRAGREVEEVSLGDIVLSGGEPAALAILDACIRLLPGVMGAPSSGAEESFEEGLLEYPHYTRPQSNGKGARSLKCCDRGIMRRSLHGARPGAKKTHGYAGRTFGSATTALGPSLPLARGEKRRTRANEPDPAARGRSNRQASGRTFPNSAPATPCASA